VVQIEVEPLDYNRIRVHLTAWQEDDNAYVDARRARRTASVADAPAFPDHRVTALGVCVPSEECDRTCCVAVCSIAEDLELYVAWASDDLGRVLRCIARQRLEATDQEAERRRKAAESVRM
jgi:hypothetical protein